MPDEITVAVTPSPESAVEQTIDDAQRIAAAVEQAKAEGKAEGIALGSIASEIQEAKDEAASASLDAAFVREELTWLRNSQMELEAKVSSMMQSLSTPLAEEVIAAETEVATPQLEIVPESAEESPVPKKRTGKRVKRLNFW